MPFKLPSLEALKVMLLGVIALALIIPYIRAVFDAPALAQGEDPANRVQNVRIVQAGTPLVVRPEQPGQFFPVNTVVCRNAYPQFCYVRTGQN